MRRKDGQSSAQHALEDIDRETVFHPNTSIVDHLKKGPHIVAQASGVRVKDRQGRDLIDATPAWVNDLAAIPKFEKAPPPR